MIRVHTNLRTIALGRVMAKLAIAVSVTLMCWLSAPSPSSQWQVSTWGVPTAHAQQLGQGMDRSGTVGIQNEDEKRLFSSLICTCGCPREALDTCTCGFAHARRDELRAAMAEGKDIEQIKAEYAEVWGPAALAVPPNEGIHRWVWALPLMGIVIGAGGAIVMIRRWRRRSNEHDQRRLEEATAEREKADRSKKKGKKAKKGGVSSEEDAGKADADEYDKRLDAELRNMK